jgi:hypothetical protein
MKNTIHATTGLVFLFAASVVAGEPGEVERGPHHSAWKVAVTNRLADGRTVVRTNRYVEVATGLNYQNDGGWRRAEEKVEQHPDGAISTSGRHKVTYAANLNTFGAIRMIAPDGHVLQSHVLALGYGDVEARDFRRDQGLRWRDSAAQSGDLPGRLPRGGR